MGHQQPGRRVLALLPGQAPAAQAVLPAAAGPLSKALRAAGRPGAAEGDEGRVASVNPGASGR